MNHKSTEQLIARLQHSRLLRRAQCFLSQLYSSTLIRQDQRAISSAGYFHRKGTLGVRALQSNVIRKQASRRGRIYADFFLSVFFSRNAFHALKHRIFLQFNSRRSLLKGLFFWKLRRCLRALRQFQAFAILVKERRQLILGARCGHETLLCKAIVSTLLRSANEVSSPSSWLSIYSRSVMRRCWFLWRDYIKSLPPSAIRVKGKQLKNSIPTLALTGSRGSVGDTAPLMDRCVGRIDPRSKPRLNAASLTDLKSYAVAPESLNDFHHQRSDRRALAIGILALVEELKGELMKER